jgi:hypothetical protein
MLLAAGVAAWLGVPAERKSLEALDTLPDLIETRCHRADPRAIPTVESEQRRWDTVRACSWMRRL